MASGYRSSSIPLIWTAQSFLVLLSVMATCRFPVSGSTSMKISATPFRTYSSSTRLGRRGAQGTGSRTSPTNCLLDSSMQTTGHWGS